MQPSCRSRKPSARRSRQVFLPRCCRQSCHDASPSGRAGRPGPGTGEGTQPVDPGAGVDRGHAMEAVPHGLRDPGHRHLRADHGAGRVLSQAGARRTLAYPPGCRPAGRCSPPPPCSPSGRAARSPSWTFPLEGDTGRAGRRRSQGRRSRRRRRPGSAGMLYWPPLPRIAISPAGPVNRCSRRSRGASPACRLEPGQQQDDPGSPACRPARPES